MKYSVRRILIAILGIVMLAGIFGEYCTLKREVLAETGKSAGYAGVLEITMVRGNEGSISKDRWSKIRYSITYGGTLISNQTALIKGRGNYTWGQPKRPYAIKCDEKADWFGMGKAKDWVLLANITDQTLMRNMVCLTLAKEMEINYAPDFYPVQVYINGDYTGLYVVAEKIEIDKRRVDLTEKEGALILELDNNYGGAEPEHFSSYMGNTYVVKDPEVTSEMSSEEKSAHKKAVKYAKAQIDAFESGIVNLKGFADFSQYMDMDSMVNWYIFNEIAKNDDTLFNSSIYLTVSAGEKLSMGPVWDFDLALAGIDRNEGRNVDPEGFMFTQDYWGRPNWFDYLLKSTTFNNMVKERWTQLYASGVFNFVADYISSTGEQMKKDAKMNSEKWGKTGVFVPQSSYSKAVGVLKDFYVRRIAWLNKQWNTDGVKAAPASEYTPVGSRTAGPQRTKAPRDSQTSSATEIPAVTAPTEAPEGNNAGGSMSSKELVLIFAAVLAGCLFVFFGIYCAVERIKKK